MRLLPFLLLSSIFFPASFQTSVTFKVGAWGDDASRGNYGVKAQIETSTYDLAEGSFNYFWVDDDLSDGAFIQFGYSLEPGLHCLHGVVSAGTLTCEASSEAISNSDARWEWQYWPDLSSPNFSFGIGPAGSAGSGATVHEYAIVPTANTWSFQLDNVTVAGTTFSVSPSLDPALIIAEGSVGNSSEQLGPTRFSRLSYFDGSEWRTVQTLIAASYCGSSVGCAANEYGAIATGPNSLVVGSGVPRSPDGSLLWTSQEETIQIDVHPGVQFFVTSVNGTQAYVGSANVTAPRDMYAYVSLPDTQVSTPGLLGLFGAQDQFQGWVGAVQSRNLTAEILVGSNENITAVWTTDATVPEMVLVLLVIFSIVVPAALAIKKRRNRWRSA